MRTSRPPRGGKFSTCPYPRPHKSPERKRRDLPPAVRDPPASAGGFYWGGGAAPYEARLIQARSVSKGTRSASRCLVADSLARASGFMKVDRVLILAAASAVIGDLGRRRLYDQRRCYEAGRVKAGHTAMQNPPDWWSFELELSGHILDRMLDRGFSEADLRLMFETASLMRAGRLDGRWIVETTHQRESWEIVVEPDYADRVIVVVTAYRRGVK